MLDDRLEVTWTTAERTTPLTDFWVKLTDDYGLMRREINVFFYPPVIRDALGTDYSVEVIDRREGFDFPEGDAEVEIRGKSVTATLPGNVIDPPEGKPRFYWYAGIGTDEFDESGIDTCPDPSEGDDWPIPPPGPIPPRSESRTETTPP